MVLSRLAVVLLLALCFSTASAAAAAVDIWLKADIRIDADGRLAELNWREQGPLHALAARGMEQKLDGWEFEPARLDGLPVETRTGLLIRVQAKDSADGGVTLRLKEARTGPLADVLVPPRYPVNAARSGVQAIVLVDVLVGVDGKAGVTDMKFEGSAGERNRKDFLAATGLAVEAWTFQPEVVAGQPVPTRMRIPVDFCLDGTPWCERQSARMQLADTPRGQPLALDSAVALKTTIDDAGS